MQPGGANANNDYSLSQRQCPPTAPQCYCSAKPNVLSSCFGVAPIQLAPQASCSARDRSCKKEGKGVLQRFTIHAVFPRRLSIRPGLDWTRGQPIKVGVAGCVSRNGMRFEELPTSQVEAVSRRVSELRRWRHGRCEWDSLMVGAA